MGWTFTSKPANLREFFNREFNYDKPAEGRSGKLIAFAQRGWSEAYGAYEIKTATETRVYPGGCGDDQTTPPPTGLADHIRRQVARNP